MNSSQIAILIASSAESSQAWRKQLDYQCHKLLAHATSRHLKGQRSDKAEELRAYSQSLPLILELGIDQLRRIAALSVTTQLPTPSIEGAATGESLVDAFHRAFTTVSLGGRNDLDNASIDTDLARAYAE